MSEQPISIAIASGKGGTGKTFVSTMLFSILAREFRQQLELVDCDVEEPNDLLFFPEAKRISTTEITKRVPVIDPLRCTFCRRCAEYCEFNAIVVLPSISFAEVNKDLCHSCGACTVACNDPAITETEEPIGAVHQFGAEHGARLVEGRLKIGSTMQTMLIRKLKKRLDQGVLFRILDAPPGTSCPVVETIADTQYVVLVAEPTPFGLHDLKLMVSLLNEIEKPFGVIINKAGSGDHQLNNFLDEQGIELLGEIPFSRKIAESYAGGQLLTKTDSALRQQMIGIATTIRERAMEKVVKVGP
jgi:MinD superfamily P-loop ATPase